MKADELLSYSPFCAEQEKAEQLFREAMLESLQFHYEKNEVYRNYCDNLKFNPYQENLKLEDIPYLPIQLFKKKKMLSVPETDIVDMRKSSSTSTGIPSVVYRDQITLERYQKSRNAIFDQFIKDRGKVHICLGQQPEKDRHISRNLVNELIGDRAQDAGTFYLMQDDKMDWEKFHGIVQQCQKEGKKIGLIYGGTAILYLFVILPLLKRHIKIQYDGYIAHGGGWKKLQNMQVSKQKFMSDLQKVFDMPASHVIDMYGFSESNSMFIDCEYGRKHIPVWNKVIIRDSHTLKPVEDGKPGIIQILDVIPHSYPGNSLLTDDIGYLFKEKQCRCGRAGTTFQMLKRANGSEAKGCGDMLADYLESREK